MNFSGLIFSFFLAFFLSACGTDNSETTTIDTNTTVPTTDPTIDINVSATGVATLSIVNGNRVTVTGSGETKEIYIMAFNENNSLDTEGEISFQYPTEVVQNGTDLGTVSPTRATIEEGFVHFTYTSPSDLKARESEGYTGTSFTFYDVQNPTTNIILYVDFNSSDDGYTIADPVLKTLILSPGTLDIATNNYTQVMTLLAFTDQSTTNIDAQVNVKYPAEVIANNIDVGYIKPTIDIVAGKATFTYTGPSDVAGTIAKLQDANLSNDVVINIYDAATGTNVDLALSFVDDAIIQTPKIHVDVPDATITLTSDAEILSVRILAFDDNNQAFNSGTIAVEYPSEIVDDNLSAGKFLESEVGIVNGEAVFSFVGPDPLTSLKSLNFTFVYKEEPSVTTVLTVNYLPVIPSVVLPITTKDLTSNNEIVNIEVKVYDDKNNPYTSGNVNIIYPDDIKDGRDIGSFVSSSVELSSGAATFIYTAPSQLDLNTSDIVFKFYHEANPTEPKTFTFTLTPDLNQTILTSYKLASSIEETNVTMELNSSKLMSFFVENDKGDLVPDEDMISVTVSLLNPTLGILSDNTGLEANTIVINNKNSVTLSLQSYTTSGIMPIKVDASFTDINDENQTLTQVYNIIILSGPPTAISLSYAGTEQNASNAKFIENWVLTVTDRYNNHINTNPAVSMGMLAGYAQSSATTSNIANYLFYRTFEGNGTLDGVTDTFAANSAIGSSNIFANVDQTNDYLVTFGNGYTYNASGKWTINTNVDTAVLDLVDDYNGTLTSELGFAVGNNKRQDMCEDGVEWVGNVYPEDNNYIIDSTGSMRLNVEYDYYLTGKDVMLWVNLVGQQNTDGDTVRIGEAKKITLRGLGLTGESYSFSAGFEGVVTLKVGLSETVEWLKNANFSYIVTVASDDANWTVSDTSMAHGITYCYGNANQTGISYVDVNFTSPTPNAGSVTLENLLIGDEF